MKFKSSSASEVFFFLLYFLCTYVGQSFVFDECQAVANKCRYRRQKIKEGRGRREEGEERREGEEGGRGGGGGRGEGEDTHHFVF
jgi:hypothetical protein